MDKLINIHGLIQSLPQTGRVEWIGLRPARREKMNSVTSARFYLLGIEGDRYTGHSGKRAVTLIQAEHLTVIASLLHRDSVQPEMLRRNLVVSGINLLALKNRPFEIGGVVLEMTGLCQPCSYMEQLFGAGGYNAVRGHGGITARVVEPGVVKLGDPVRVA